MSGGVAIGVRRVVVVTSANYRCVLKAKDSHLLKKSTNTVLTLDFYQLTETLMRCKSFIARDRSGIRPSVCQKKTKVDDELGAVANLSYTK